MIRRGYTAAVGRPHFLAPLLAQPQERLVIRTRDVTLATSVELAADSAARRRGLLGRDSLAPGAALVIAPCSGVHTFGMAFAIDVIYTSRDGTVLKIRRAMPPGRLSHAAGAFAAIEMSAGAADAAGLQAGDRLVIEIED
jgi:uncharacterized membrane protein (UPF0127 family)